MPRAPRPSRSLRAAARADAGVVRASPHVLAVAARVLVRLAAPALAATLLGTSALRAQPIPRRPVAAAPTTWASASAALLQAESIRDGRTNAIWDFGTAVQYRATLEAVVAPGATVGVQGSWAPSVPTTVSTLGLADRPRLAGCESRCAASAELLAVDATGRLGGGEGLHQVIELAAGVQQLRRLRLDDDVRLAPERDTDLHAAAGYGVGFGFSARIAVALVQEFGIVVHQRDFLPRDRSAITQQRVTRLTVRYGSGARR